ncbi:MAG: acyltransferase [Bacteroidia bacterium]
MNDHQERIQYLDSSRGIAALVVFISHFILVFFPSLNFSSIAHTPLHLIWDGSAAVMYFFIHSGFILCYRLEQRNFNLTLRSYLAFVGRRIFRIYPVFIFCLIMMYVAIRLNLFQQNPLSVISFPLNEYWQSSVSIMSVLKQALLLIRIPNEPVLRLLPQDWTLSIEIAISLILPFLYLLRSQNAVWILVFVYLSVHFLSLDGFVFDFALGISIVSIYPHFTLWWKSNSSTFVKFIIVLFAILFMSTDHILPPKIFSILELIFIHSKAWGCALMMLILLSSVKLKKLFSYGFLTLQGKISYSLYLVHLPLLFIIYPLGSALTFPGLILFLMVYVLGYFISFLLYTGIEMPMIRTGKNLSRKIFKIG